MDRTTTGKYDPFIALLLVAVLCLAVALWRPLMRLITVGYNIISNNNSLKIYIKIILRMYSLITE